MTPRYWAFLSYSHSNEVAAAKLHSALESYSLPASVRKAHALPRRLVPVFRDVEELEAAAGLTTRLQAALDDSRWLIVLCSAAAAQSKYVNAEIEYFLGRHGPSRILCVLLEGEPKDSYPPAIRALSDEPLAADLRPGADPQLAVLKLIAAMATVGFTELRNREAQRTRRQRAWLLGGALTTVVAGLAGWDLYFRTHVSHFIGYERRHGIWEGQFPLSGETASHRTWAYRFTRHGRLRPPVRVEFVNGSGSCPNAHLLDSVDGMVDLLNEEPAYSDWRNVPRYCSASFDYRPDGSIAVETMRNALDLPALTLLYTKPTLAQLTYNGFASASGGGIRYVRIDESADGYIAEMRFLYGEGLPRPNAEGAYGLRFERDAGERVSRRMTLDSEGRPGASEQLRYDSNFGVHETWHEGSDGAPRYNVLGEHRERRSFDGYGNLAEVAWFGPDGQPANLLNPTMSVRNTFDQRGNVTKTCSLDARGEPVVSDGISCRSRSYDGGGNRTGLQYLSPEGSQAATTDGYSQLRYEYDERGSVIGYSYHGTQGELVRSWRGSALNTIERDAHGNVVVERFFGPDRKLAHTSTGAEQRTVYDSHDRPVEMAFFDVSGRPAIAGQATRSASRTEEPVWGFARMRMERDERGNVQRERFFGMDGAPILTRNGFATREFIRDEAGNIEERRFLDTKGALVNASHGYAVQKSAFDKRGVAIEERYFDRHGILVASDEGHFGFTATRDDLGRLTQKRYFDASGRYGKPAGLGYAGVSYRYGANGNIAETLYFDARGQPPPPPATAREIRDYDVLERLVEIRHEARDGAPARSGRSACTRETYAYDASGQLLEEQCLDQDGQPANRRSEGWARRMVTVENARVVKEEWFDAAGRAVKPRR